MDNPAYINVLISDGGAIQLVADVDLEVVGVDDVDTIHISDVFGMILQKTREQDAARIPPGNYTVRALLTLVGESSEVQDAND